jgi:hypothetical protein
MLLHGYHELFREAPLRTDPLLAASFIVTRTAKPSPNTATLRIFVIIQSLIDPKTNTVVGTIKVGNLPISVAVDLSLCS